MGPASAPGCDEPTSPGLKQDGFKPVQSIPLKEIPASALAHLCDNFRAAVFEKAGKTDDARATEAYLKAAEEVCETQKLEIRRLRDKIDGLNYNLENCREILRDFPGLNCDTEDVMKWDIRRFNLLSELTPIPIGES